MKNWKQTSYEKIESKNELWNMKAKTNYEKNKPKTSDEK